MSDIFLPAEAIKTGPCRIDIIEYKRNYKFCKHVLFDGRGYDVLFNGVEVGLVYRRQSSVCCWWIDGPVWTGSYRTRGEAASALIRSVYPDWKGCAP